MGESIEQRIDLAIMFGDSEMFSTLILGAGKLELIKEKLEKCVWWALIGHM